MNAIKDISRGQNKEALENHKGLEMNGLVYAYNVDLLGGII
jgi:hypothetical protein